MKSPHRNNSNSQLTLLNGREMSKVIKLRFGVIVELHLSLALLAKGLLPSLSIQVALS